MNNPAPKTKSTAQMAWGIALVLAGLGVFLRVSQVMPKLAQIESFSNVLWFIRFCFYLMGIILIGGGAKKIVGYFRVTRSVSLDGPVDPADS